MFTSLQLTSKASFGQVEKQSVQVEELQRWRLVAGIPGRSPLVVSHQSDFGD